MRGVLRTNHSVAPPGSALKSTMKFKRQKRVSASRPLMIEHHLLIKFLKDFGFAEYAGQLHGSIRIIGITHTKSGTSGYALAVQSTHADGTTAPRKMVYASNEVMEDNSKRHAKILELVAMVPQKQKETSHVSPQKTPGEIHRDQRAENFDKQGKQSTCSTQISSSTRTSTMQSTLASIEKQAQQAEFSDINREKNWGGTRSGIRKIVATRKRTMRKPTRSKVWTVLRQHKRPLYTRIHHCVSIF